MLGAVTMSGIRTWKENVKTNLEETKLEFVDLSVSVAGCCDYGNELLGLIICR